MGPRRMISRRRSATSGGPSTRRSEAASELTEEKNPRVKPGGEDRDLTSPQLEQLAAWENWKTTFTMTLAFEAEIEQKVGH
mmetsp:Transcript_24603/g.79530  ORF Transcript_24603/g.79530 Transcript_24603/m.79530 type:complete len:81 (-) Transcript_24603:599-841(-)